MVACDWLREVLIWLMRALLHPCRWLSCRCSVQLQDRLFRRLKMGFIWEADHVGSR